jgi:hypothetical protein
MSLTTFSGPVRSLNGFEGDMTGDVTLADFVKLTAVATAALPAAAAGNAGQVRLINDNGALATTNTAWLSAQALLGSPLSALP